MGHKFTREEGLLGTERGGFTTETAKTNAEKSHIAFKENRQKRNTFAELFNQYITSDKAIEIAKAIINMPLDNTIKAQDRLKAFELILRVLGEDKPLNTQELNQLQQVIKLEIK